MLQVFDSKFRPAFTLGRPDNNDLFSYIQAVCKTPDKFKDIRGKEYHIGLSANGIADYTKGKEPEAFKQHMLCIDLDLEPDHITMKDIDVNKDKVLDFVYKNLFSEIFSRTAYSLIQTGKGFHVWLIFDDSMSEEHLKNLKRFVFLTPGGGINPNIKFKIGKHRLVVDPASFNPRRISRLPASFYDKEGVTPFTTEVLVEATTKATLSSLVSLSANLPQTVLKEEHKDKAYNNNFDFAGVIKGCNFLKYCREDSNNVSEPQWFSMMSIIKSAGTNKEDIDFQIHEHSKKYSKYNRKQTQIKLETNRIFSPNCESINMSWGGCSKCPHYGTVKNPVLIKSEEFIPTRHTGFRTIKETKKGPVVGHVNYPDLVRYYKTKVKFTNLDFNRHMVYSKPLGIWQEHHRHTLKKFCQDYVRPEPLNNNRNEFVESIMLENCTASADFGQSNCIALNNGVLDIEAGDKEKFIDFSPELEVTTKLNFDYDPKAKCPLFMKMLNTMCEGDTHKYNAIKRYAGYMLLKNNTEHHKAIIFTGEGGNGKGTLIQILLKMLGEENVCHTHLRLMNNPAYSVHLDNKLAYVINEADKNTIKSHGSTLKAIISGDRQTGKILYSHSYNFKPVCKVIIDTNHDLDIGGDFSNSWLRRLIVIKIDRQFSEAEKDIGYLAKMDVELPGILNFALEGLKELRETGSFMSEAKRLDSIKENIYKHDPVYDFCEAYLEKTVQRYLPDQRGLFKVFLTYCDESNVNIKDYTFNKFIDSCKLATKSLFDLSKTAKNMVMGVKLKGAYLPDDEIEGDYDEVNTIK